MRKFFVLLGLAAALSGCGAGEEGPGGITLNPNEPEQTAPEIPAPNLDSDSTIALIREGDIVKVGDTAEYALNVFQRPSGSYDVKELPPGGFATPLYQVRGWETDREGFAVLLYNTKVAAAIYQIENGDEERLQQMVDTYKRRLAPNEPTFLDSEAARYWFWDIGDERLMISAVRLRGDRLHITVGMGDVGTMQALQMDQDSARAEQQSAAADLRELQRTENSERPQSERTDSSGQGV